MPAHTPTYRTAAAAPAATWRQRIARAIRRPNRPLRTVASLQTPSNAAVRTPGDPFEGMDLDQRVRQLGEW